MGKKDDPVIGEVGDLWLEGLVLQIKGRFAREEIFEFFLNYEVNEGRVTSEVKGIRIRLDEKDLGDILHIPAVRYSNYTKLKWPILDDLPTSLAITKNFGNNEKA